MTKGLYIAWTGMVNAQNRMDTMTNNLANVNTTGFKKEGATSQAFDDVLAVKIKDTSEGGSSYNIRRMGIMKPGVKIGENYVDFSEGGMHVTDNTYDFALTDRGFFAVEFTSKSGEVSTKYTRDGNFTLTTDGYLVTQDGDYVLDVNGSHIKVDTLHDAFISRDGTITQHTGTSTVTTRVAGKIQIVDFENYDYLKRYGENYFEPLEGATMIEPNTQVYQGYLEMSNVQPVTEMVNMITIAREYESNQKLIQTMDSTLEKPANQLSRIQ